METYFEQSISAYKLIMEVSKSLQISETPEKSVMNGNVHRIILTCNKIIENNYQEKKTRELLKYYVAHSFFEDYDIESIEDYSGYLIN